MMFATLLRALIISVPFGIHVALTSPTPIVPKEKRMSNDYSMAMNLAFKMYKCSCWIHGTIEILILSLPVVARQLPHYAIIQWFNNTMFQLFLPSFLGKQTIIFFPPARILGGFLVLFGAIGRYMCFRELGRHFTFHLTILEKHTLVTTGLYSIVRHPAYSAGLGLSVGSILWHGTSGSWLLQSRFYTNMIAWVVFLPAIITIGSSVVMGVLSRPREEDKMLKEEFGKKWDEYARRVPYRLFPGIY